MERKWGRASVFFLFKTILLKTGPHFTFAPIQPEYLRVLPNEISNIFFHLSTITCHDLVTMACDDAVIARLKVR
jgi:hypothetical protein